MAKKRKIVIIGAGMAGLTAANRLYTFTDSTQLFDIYVVEAGSRIGGRINTSEFSGDRIEMGATWIHGIGGSPVHKIATEIQALQSAQPWECMDGFLEEQPKTFAEGGFQLNPSLVESASTLYKKLMDFAQKKLIQNGLASKSDEDEEQNDDADAERLDFYEIAVKAYNDLSAFEKKQISIGDFVKKGFNAYWDSVEDREELKGYGKWSRKSLEEAVFSIFENTERTYTSAGDLSTLDFTAESEYIMFPGEEITIAKGYLSIIESLASVLPPGLIQLEKKVSKINWRPNKSENENENGFDDFKPVKLHFSDGSTMLADHVIITVSLGVLKSEISKSSSSGMFNPSLPCFKTEAISRLGFGVVNKLFLEISHDEETCFFPSLQMAFHPSGSELRCRDIPWWMRKTASLSPIYKDSKVVLAWFAGEEALELESLSDEEIINGVTTTISKFLPKPTKEMAMESKSENGNGFMGDDDDDGGDEKVRFTRVLKSKWGNDPLFLGSYSYVAVGSSGDDLDKMAEPLPKIETFDESSDGGGGGGGGGGSGGGVYPLQILFAGEATHRTHYSTTHGAYFSGLREANRLLNYYHCV